MRRMVRRAFAVALAVSAVPAFAARDGITVVGLDELWYTRGSQQSGGAMAKVTEGVRSEGASEGKDVRAAHDGAMQEGGAPRAQAPTRDPADLQPDFGG